VSLSVIRSVPVPAGQGAACTVRQSELLRVVDVQGGQVADLNAWSLADFKEWFWSARTRIMQRAHLSVGDRLWSSPNMAVMFTITADTVQPKPSALGCTAHTGSACGGSSAAHGARRPQYPLPAACSVRTGPGRLAALGSARGDRAAHRGRRAACAATLLCASCRGSRSAAPLYANLPAGGVAATRRAPAPAAGVSLGRVGGFVGLC
jgi:hypothetical protein